MLYLSGARILVTGGTGFLGRYVCQKLSDAKALVLPISRRLGYDLTDEAQAYSAFLIARPDIVIHLAATVGGIGANMARPATFFRDNLKMGMNVVHAASAAGAKVVMLSTVCAYPRDCPVPFLEETLWDGYPESTNAPYGIAKKALLVMLQAYRNQHGLRFSYLIPCNLYGPGDNTDESSSHVIPALIRRFVEAREADAPQVTCWGTGKATRSFLYVEDAAQAIVQAAAGLDDDRPVNLPGGPEIAMSDLAGKIASLVGYDGKIEWDASKPDGQPRRFIDGRRAEKLLGWKPETLLDEGLKKTIQCYKDKREKGAPQK